MKVLANDGISVNAVNILNKSGFDVYLDKIEQDNLIPEVLKPEKQNLESKHKSST